MKANGYLFLAILLGVAVAISGCGKQQARDGLEGQNEIIVKGPKELKMVVSPSTGNILSNEVMVKIASAPAETTAVAFVLVPSGEQFALNHVLWWDENGNDGWSYKLDTHNFGNAAYSLMAMVVKQKGEQPLEIASANVVIRNEEVGFTPPPTTTVNYRKSLALSEYSGSRSDIKGAKGLGANMVTLAFNLDITEDNQVKVPFDPTNDFRNLKKKLSNLISEAHKQGLQVELRTAMVPQSAGATDTEKLLANMLLFMQEWSKFAEEHKVYSFTTFGEVDDGKHSKELNKLNKAVLSEVRRNYNGKVGVGFCCTYSKVLSQEGREQQYDLSGYDYIIISIYPGGGEGALQRYYDLFRPAISSARAMADKYGVGKVFIGEVGVMNPGEKFLFDYTATLSQEQEAEFYDKMFTATNTLVDGYTVAYNFPIGSIKGQPAEKVVSEWYGRFP